MKAEKKQEFFFFSIYTLTCMYVTFKHTHMQIPFLHSAGKSLACKSWVTKVHAHSWFSFTLYNWEISP